MGRQRPLAGLASLPWLLATALMIALIWGNSMVPGEGSSGISLYFVDLIRGALDGVGLPSGWVTNFLVRKTAHFCEYACLGAIAFTAFDPDRRLDRRGLAICAVLCVLVPSIDETIQLFVSGRSGQIADVMLDMSGAAVGMLIRGLAVRTLDSGRRTRRRAEGD